MIQNGAQVQLHYTLKVEGEVVDTSREREPLTYTHGRGELIPGLEEQISEMEEGQQKHVAVPPEKAYGPVDPEAFGTFTKDSFQNMPSLKVGDVVGGELNGRPFRATVAEIKENEVTLNLNHPLAGKTLEFDVNVVKVKSGNGA